MIQINEKISHATGLELILLKWIYHLKTIYRFNKISIDIFRWTRINNSKIYRTNKKPELPQK